LPYLKTFDYNGIKIHVKAADFTEIMQKVVQSLENALHFVSNENQKNMITAYIEHFKYGE
jgi:dipeptidyl-peptidase-3